MSQYSNRGRKIPLYPNWVINLLTNLGNLTVIIRSAGLTSPVRKTHNAALGALYKTGNLEFPVRRTPLISPSFRDFPFWNRHNDTSCYYFSRSCPKTASLGSISALQSQGPSFKFLPHFSQRPLQSSRHRNRCSIFKTKAVRITSSKSI